ncbi:MAG: shikimate kinase, partial [Pirellulaceae bacterium]|nr:shikimate kinase [Pirellulaceae bacterium]
ENSFRDLESSIASELMTRQEAVIAWGGGIILRQENRLNIKRSNLTVWLSASAEVLAKRILDDRQSLDNRPALSTLLPLEEIQMLLQRREPLYRDTADWTISTDTETPTEIAESIINHLKNK